MGNRKTLYKLTFLLLFLSYQSFGYAQGDSLHRSGLDSILSSKKGVVGRLAKNLLADTTQGTGGVQRNDQAFAPYHGRTIRHIIIKSLPFGVSIGDTTKVLNNKLTHLANHLHRRTRNGEIMQNLFFKQNDTLSPPLLGDNERYLRDLPYIQDARIKVQPVPGSNDSVDVVVLTKDVVSIGGGLDVHNSRSATATLKEDNFYGLGDRYQVQLLYDLRRSQRLGYGFEYIKRNIEHTFIDGTAGYLTFAPAFNTGRTEERMGYLQLVKPLVNPYVRWTYAVDASWHASQNLYAADSAYDDNLRYKFHTIDAWGAWNTSAGHIAGRNEANRLRMVMSLRFLDQHFLEKPLKYMYQYYYPYANLTALLGSLSIFQQNFYKVEYLYGFGRPEDVPEGVDATFMIGWTEKNARERPYMGINFQRFYFTRAEQYFNFSVQAGSYLYQHHFEDVNLQAGINFFDHLHDISPRWKERTFLTAGFVKQFNSLLNEPVFPTKLYGLYILNDYPVGGDLRMNVNGEFVFYSPWSLLYFRIAPFGFVDASLFRYNLDSGAKTDLYPAIGGGVRIRNESLIFKTIELKGWYFPNKNYRRESFRIQFQTKVRFTYNEKFIRRPEFIQVN